jgi:Bacterial extracellular solute-binding proteins, family 5 Middle
MTDSTSLRPAPVPVPVRPAAHRSVAPQLVQSFSCNAGKTQMTLKLKSGVTFTDGSTLTAQLVKENLDRRSNSKLTSYGAFAAGGSAQIKSVAAADQSTVVLTFAAPQANFETQLVVMRQAGTSDLKLWLPDGTNYPGQDDLRAPQDRLAGSLAEIYALLDPEHRLLIEYKFFEPHFYAMDIPDWGTSLLNCLALGERARVVLDTGHHAPGTNIEFIVMQLLRMGRLGAFDFNSRNYADDDLIVGSADPFQLFRIMNEIVAAGARPGPRGQLHAGSVPQHRAEDPGPDPLGDERPGSHGQGVARRPRRTRQGAAGR